MIRSRPGPRGRRPAARPATHAAADHAPGAHAPAAHAPGAPSPAAAAPAPAARPAGDRDKARAMLAHRFDQIAGETHPDRHVILLMLEEAMEILYAGGEPTPFELHHLSAATRALHGRLPADWQQSARQAACALRDPGHGAASDKRALDILTRRDLDRDLRAAKATTGRRPIAVD